MDHRLEDTVFEKVFEVLLYSIGLFVLSFIVCRFGGEGWSFNYPLSAFGMCLLLSQIYLSLNKSKDLKLYLRIGLPTFCSLIVWYTGDFSNGIVNAFQEVFSFKHLLILFVSIVISLFLDGSYSEEGTSREEVSKVVSKSGPKVSTNFEDIIGQDHVIAPLKEIARLASAKIKVGKENSPYAVLLFLGPTGVGKTEAARSLAKAVYGTTDALIRFDMGQFADAHQANRFYGPPPGYVGYEQGGQLTRAVLKRPRSVILLDEVEKADPKIWDAFLPVFDEGYIVDGSSNQKVDMRQTIIVLTSNLLAEQKELFLRSPLDVKNAIQLTGAFRPELIGRINEVLIFKSLEANTIREILQKRVDNALWSLSEQGIRVSIDPQEIDEMVLELQSAKFGVRQIDDVLRSRLRKLVASQSSQSLNAFD